METYCSAAALESAAACAFPNFSAGCARGDARCGEVWERYLDDLGLAIYNAQMLLNASVLLGGEVARYMTQADLSALSERALRNSGIARDVGLPRIRLSGRSDSAAGAALHFIENYLYQLGVAAED